LDEKIGELWSTNKKVIGAHIDPPDWTYWGDYRVGQKTGATLFYSL